MSRLKRFFGKPLPKFSDDMRKKQKRRGRPANEVDSVPALLDVPVKSVESTKTQSLSKKTNSERLNLDPKKVGKGSQDMSDKTIKSNSKVTEFFFVYSMPFLKGGGMSKLK